MASITTRRDGKSGIYLIAVALLAGASTAMATPVISVRLDVHDPQLAVFGRSVIDPANGQRVTASNMQGGRFGFRVTGGDFSGPLVFSAVNPNIFYGFCIEPREFVSLGGSYSYNVNPLALGTTNIGGMGGVKAGRLRELFGRYYPDFSQPLTRQQAGALQIAVWEIVRENTGTLNVYTGDIYFFTPQDNPAGTVALAQTYVQSINGLGPQARGLIALTQTGLIQDVVVQTENPEPAAGVLIGAGLAVLGMIRARRAAARLR